MATKSYNQEYYAKNRESEKQRSLNRYHQNKDRIDREKKKAYMAEYRKTYKKRPLTSEERSERNRLRRERYASDPEHREKLREQARRSRKPAQKRAAHLKREFDLTPEAFQSLLEEQGGGCAICQTKMTGLKERGRRERSLHVDHCHKTKAVRGILCHRCNFGLGHFRDNPALLETAAQYLRSSSGVT